MGFEYQCSLDADQTMSLSELAAFFRRSGNYRILSETESALSMAYSAEVVRAHWPEDVLIAKSGQKIDVVIHSGTRRQREMIISDLGAGFCDAGVKVEIEEQ